MKTTLRTESKKLFWRVSEWFRPIRRVAQKQHYKEDECPARDNIEWGTRRETVEKHVNLQSSEILCPWSVYLANQQQPAENEEKEADKEQIGECYPHNFRS